jgi:hypothetical protein
LQDLPKGRCFLCGLSDKTIVNVDVCTALAEVMEMGRFSGQDFLKEKVQVPGPPGAGSLKLR